MTDLVQAQKDIKQKIDTFFKLKNKISADEKELKEMKKDIMTFMENSATQRLEGDTCKITLIQKATPSVPKDATNKTKLFALIKKEKGEDVLNEMLTINSRSFGSFYNAEEAASFEDGEFDFKIDGVEEPHNVSSLMVRKK